MPVLSQNAYRAREDREGGRYVVRLDVEKMASWRGLLAAEAKKVRSATEETLPKT